MFWNRRKKENERLTAENEQLKKEKEHLEGSINEAEEAFFLIQEKSRSDGTYLMDHIFMPEDLLFTPTDFESEDGPTITVYHRDGFNLARPASSKTKEWTLQTPEGEKFSFEIPNMFYAIERLNFCGMENISLAKYYESMAALGEKLTEIMESEAENT